MWYKSSDDRKLVNFGRSCLHPREGDGTSKRKETCDVRGVHRRDETVSPGTFSQWVNDDDLPPARTFIPRTRTRKQPSAPYIL